MAVLARAARFLLRVAGWLLTPVVLTLTAALGATIVAVVAPLRAPDTAILLMAVGGLVGAVLGLLAWERLLGRSPALRAALAVTAEGLPEPAAVEALIAGHTETAEDDSR